MKKKVNFDRLRKEIQSFIKERNWGQFHSPKNLSMSLSIEAAELMEHFQWANTAEESRKILENKHKRIEIEDEIADIAIYLIDFCNLYGVDFEKAILRKMKKNERKYPAKLVKGRMEKYTHYEAQLKKKRGK